VVVEAARRARRGQHLRAVARPGPKGPGDQPRAAAGLLGAEHQVVERRAVERRERQRHAYRAPRAEVRALDAVEGDDRQAGRRAGVLDLRLARQAAEHDDAGIRGTAGPRQAGERELLVELAPVVVLAGDDQRLGARAAHVAGQPAPPPLCREPPGAGRSRGGRPARPGRPARRRA
jgi:hypothetical protein